MIKITLQQLLCIILFCTLLIPYVSTQEIVDDNFIDNDLDNDAELDEIELDKSFVNHEEVNHEEVNKVEFDDDEERMRNVKMPHVDGKKEKIVKKIDIPKIIHQYVKSKENISNHIQNNINSWKSLNSNWEYRLYDYSDMKNFMENEYSKLVDLWNVLDYDEKIHMWKYAVLDKVGGAYINANCYCTKPIDEWLNKFDTSNIILGLDYLIIPDKILNEKKITDSIQFNIRTIISAPGHEILSKMPFYIHRYRVLGNLNAIEADPYYRQYGRTFFSAGTALFTESVFDYLIENNVVLENIVNGGLVKDVAILNSHGFSYESTDINNLPDDVYSLYYPEKAKLKEKNDYIL